MRTHTHQDGWLVVYHYRVLTTPNGWKRLLNDLCVLFVEVSVKPSSLGLRDDHNRVLEKTRRILVRRWSWAHTVRDTNTTTLLNFPDSTSHIRTTVLELVDSGNLRRFLSYLPVSFNCKLDFPSLLSPKDRLHYLRFLSFLTLYESFDSPLEQTLNFSSFFRSSVRSFLPTGLWALVPRTSNANSYPLIVPPPDQSRPETLPGVPCDILT